MTDVPVDAIF